MELFGAFTLLLVLAAIFAYLNTRFVHLPPTVGFVLGALVLAFSLLILRHLGFGFASDLIDRLSQIDFSRTVLNGILSFLLFAGALQFDIEDLAREKWMIFTLATFGVILSAAIVGVLMYGVYAFLALPVTFAYALLFGALISPTDPVVCISILKRARIDQGLKIRILGESLFNDGISIVLFTAVLAFAAYREELSAIAIPLLLLQQIGGSIVLGLILGWITHHFLSRVDVFTVQLLITLGAVAGGYDLALVLNTSGPITVVVAGLVVRNYRPKNGKKLGDWTMLYRFWGWLDEFLNAALFVMLGLEFLTVPYTLGDWIAGVIAIGVVLAGRYISVWIPIRAFGLFQRAATHTVPLLTWAGLRGGISLALALSLPDSSTTDALSIATYLVVLFSALVQSLTLKHFLYE